MPWESTSTPASESHPTVVPLASRQTVVVRDRVELRDGATFRVNGVEYQFEDVGKPSSVTNGYCFEIDVNTRTPTIDGLTLVDEAGNTVDFQLGAPLKFKEGDRNTSYAEWHALPAKVDHVKVIAHVWDDAKTITLPVDVQVGITDPDLRGGV